jgi:branched-chain amino acid aminotransferase
MQAFFNRRFVPEKQVRISAFDRGLLYGDGVFETMRIYGGRFFWLDKHLTRLLRGLRTLGIRIPYNSVELEFFLRELVLRNGVRDGFARILVTRGEGVLGFSPRGAGTPQIVMVARSRSLDAWLRRHPVWRLCLLNGAVGGYGFKTLSYLPHVLAKKEAEKNGYEDPILVDEKGCVMEAAASNVFIAEDHKLWTPPLSSGCLEGITRKAVITVARKAGARVIEKPLPVGVLRKAKEIFITNSMLELVPCVLGKKISRRVPVHTLAWQEKFEQFRDSHLA